MTRDVRAPRGRRGIRSLPPRLALGALVLAAASPCLAQGSTAEVLFNDGRAALERGDYNTACSKLAESLRLSGEGGPRLSLAECEERRGRLAVALEVLNEAARVLPAGSVQGKTAAARAAALDPRVPLVTIDLDPKPAGDVRIEIDGKPIAGATARVDPGDHVVAATAAGCEPANASLHVGEGERRRVPLSMSCGAGASSGDASSPGSTQRTIGFVVGGVGALGAIGFAVTGVMALSKQGTVNQHCQPRCDPTGLAAASDGKTIDVVNAVAFGVGIAGLGAGVVLFLTAPRATSTASVGFGAVPGGRGAFGPAATFAF